MSRLLRQEIKEVTEAEPPDQEIVAKGNFEAVISTGSTLLDCTISGTRIRGGGIPAGILVEISGPSGFGKTTILSEIGASAQSKGGYFILGDAEQRLSKEYAEMMGLKITEKNYRTPYSVKDCGDIILETPTTGGGVIDVSGIDSIASLCSELDQSEDGDKRGSARAKELHQLCRKCKGEVAKSTRLVVFTNQIQDVQDAMKFGPKEKTPGGHAVPFYSSLRIRIGPAPSWRLKNKIKFAGKDQEEQSGITSRCTVFKSTIDRPYRECDIHIVFGYGIDDIRANVQYCRRFSSDTSYQLRGEALGSSINDAVAYIEHHELEEALRERTIDIWESIQVAFMIPRKTKVR